MKVVLKTKLVSALPGAEILVQFLWWKTGLLEIKSWIHWRHSVSSHDETSLGEGDCCNLWHNWSNTFWGVGMCWHKLGISTASELCAFIEWGGISMSNQFQMKSCALGMMHTEIISQLWTSVINFSCSVLFQGMLECQNFKECEDLSSKESQPQTYPKNHRKNICWLKMLVVFHLTHFTTWFY